MSNWFSNRIANYRLVSDAIDKYISKDLPVSRKIGIMVDFFLEAKIHHIELTDYIQYQFYKKKSCERRTFVCSGEYQRIVKKANDAAYFKYFDQKPLFNETFSKYMGRRWLDATKCTFQEFSDFLDSVDAFFLKLTNGSLAQGTGKVRNDGTLDKEKLFEEYKSTNIMLEEVVEQHSELAEFNQSSVNTIRIVTFLTADGTVKIMPSIIRFGRAGQVVDNFHHYGIVSFIDVDTGILITTGVDRNFDRYVIHPDSKKQIVGFHVPEWEKVVATVKEAALLVPQVRYVGWDVAVGKNGEIIFIEGNKSADPDASQVSDQIGKWNEYRPLLEELEKAGKSVKC